MAREFLHGFEIEQVAVNLAEDITFRHSMHLTARNWLGLRLNSGGFRRFSQLSVQ